MTTAPKKRTLFTPTFWADTAERGIATAGEVAISAFSFDLIRNAVTGGDWTSLYWTGGAVIGAAGLAVVKAIVAAARADTDTASLSKTVAKS